ncbi:MAG: CBS domain-containing protein [Saprospiraceae bacterium]|nr:CBS domain-containing protein [Saprospiraceae bacterium]MDW8483005.1 CBS domain-containing protein [Saprospiraceae bacterium]
MTSKPITVAPNDTMDKVRELLEKEGFHHLPVVEHGKLVGLVSYTDYLRLIRDVFNNSQEARVNERLLNATLVKEVMTEHLLCLSPDDTVETALRIFKANRFHSLPVVDEHKHLLGIVTTLDLMRVLETIFLEELRR